MKCDLGDIAVFYETYGTGRPIVMLPGKPSDHRVMVRFMEPFFTAARAGVHAGSRSCDPAKANAER